MAEGPRAKGFNFWDIAPAGGGTGAPDTVLRIGPLTFVDQCRNGTSGGVDMDLSMVDSAGEDGVDGTLTTEDATAPSPATTRFEDLGVSAGDPLYLVSTDTGNGYTQTDDDDFAISYQVLDHGTGQMFQVTVTAEANGTRGADYCNAYGVVTPTS